MGENCSSVKRARLICSVFICRGKLRIMSPVLFQIYRRGRYFLSRNVVGLMIQDAGRSGAHQEAIIFYNTVLCDLPVALRLVLLTPNGFPVDVLATA